MILLFMKTDVNICEVNNLHINIHLDTQGDVAKPFWYLYIGLIIVWWGKETWDLGDYLHSVNINHKLLLSNNNPSSSTVLDILSLSICQIISKLSLNENNKEKGQ